MFEEGLAKRYAQVLLSLAEQEKPEQIGIVEQELFDVTRLYETSANMKKILEHPLISPDKKNTLIHKLFDNRVTPIILKFIQLLINKNRISYLPQIAEAYHSLADQVRGIMRIKAKSYLPLPKDQLRILEQKMTELTAASKVIIESEIDPSLLGGIMVQFGDSVIDGSVTHQLKNMQQQLLSK